MKNVATKLLKVIGEVNGRVAKSGYNNFQKYAYIMEKDLLEAVREELVKHGLLMIMSVDHISRVGDLTTVRTKHTIIDTDSGEQIEIWSAGEGKDGTKDDIGGDKACPKAITSASKYFLLKTFQLSGGDDPENDSKEVSTNKVNNEQKASYNQSKSPSNSNVAQAKAPAPNSFPGSKFNSPTNTKFNSPTSNKPVEAVKQSPQGLMAKNNVAKLANPQIAEVEDQDISF